MATNRRRHTNNVPVAGLLRWGILAIFFVVTGLGYLHFKNGMHATGNEIKALERQLAEINTQNEMVRSKISHLSSRSQLQKRLSEGFIRMTPITDDRIVRIGSNRNRIAAATAGGLRPVPNARLRK